MDTRRVLAPIGVESGLFGCVRSKSAAFLRRDPAGGGGGWLEGGFSPMNGEGNVLTFSRREPLHQGKYPLRCGFQRGGWKKGYDWTGTFSPSPRSSFQGTKKKTRWWGSRGKTFPVHFIQGFPRMGIAMRQSEFHAVVPTLRNFMNQIQLRTEESLIEWGKVFSLSITI